MCLLESVEAWDDVTIRCLASTHRDQRNPLRFHGRLTASAGLEYAAQAMGAHVGLVDGPACGTSSSTPTGSTIWTDASW
jgi:predicted hotdog family 3-hydroxylacyl-ACP dehydratase